MQGWVRAGGRAPGRGKPPQLRSLTPRTLPVRPEPTPQGRRHWCRLTEKYCTRIATSFQNYPLSIPFSPSEPFLHRLFPPLYRLYRSLAHVFLSSLLSPSFFLALLPHRTLALFSSLSFFLSLFLSGFVFLAGHPGSSKYSMAITKRGKKNFRCHQVKFILLLASYCRERSVELLAIFF